LNSVVLVRTIASFGVVARSDLDSIDFGVVGPTRASVDYTPTNPHIWTS